jgi:hypothetical protein
MWAELNLASDSEDCDEGLGSIFLGGPRIASPAGSVHDCSSRKLRGANEEVWV